jgi:hypothetical protein
MLPNTCHGTANDLVRLGIFQKTAEASMPIGQLISYNVCDWAWDYLSNHLDLIALTDEWRSFVETTIDGVLWRWKYSDFQNKIKDLAPYCPKCKHRLKYAGYGDVYVSKCDHCGNDLTSHRKRERDGLYSYRVITDEVQRRQGTVCE